MLSDVGFRASLENCQDQARLAYIYLSLATTRTRELQGPIAAASPDHGFEQAKAANLESASTCGLVLVGFPTRDDRRRDEVSNTGETKLNKRVEFTVRTRLSANCGYPWWIAESEYIVWRTMDPDSITLERG